MRGSNITSQRAEESPEASEPDIFEFVNMEEGAKLETQDKVEDGGEQVEG